MPAPAWAASRSKQLKDHPRVATQGRLLAVADVLGAIKMFNGDAPEERSRYVAERMLRAAERVGGFGGGDWGSKLGTVSQERQRYIVRIRAVDLDTPGQLSVEGLRDLHAVCDVRMDNAAAAPYTVYPGKVFCLRGLHKLHGQAAIRGVEIVNPVPPPTAQHLRLNPAVEEADAKRRRSDAPRSAVGEAFKICVAAGPFCDYVQQTLRLLERVIKVCIKRGGVGVLLVVGPLSKDRADGDETVGLLEEDDELSGFPADMAAKYGAALPRLVFVSSLQDVFHEYVFPQPGYSFAQDDAPRKTPWLSLTNPARFDVNGVHVCATSLDVLRCMRMQSAAVRPETEVGFAVPQADPNDPMAMKPAARDSLGELLAAASLYPVLPPHPEVPLDVTLARTHADFTTTPDILILPSVQPFAEAVLLDKSAPDDRVVVVNPGYCRCPVSGGKHRLADITVSTTSAEQRAWEHTSVDWYFLEEAER